MHHQKIMGWRYGRNHQNFYRFRNENSIFGRSEQFLIYVSYFGYVSQTDNIAKIANIDLRKRLFAHIDRLIAGISLCSQFF